MFSMRLTGGAPIYEQLEKRITELIMSGEMTENEKLPAVREIAKELSINPNTVQKTYSKLEARGLIYSVPAKGSYVAAREKYYDNVREKSMENFSEAVKLALKQGLSVDDIHEIVDLVSREESEPNEFDKAE